MKTSKSKISLLVILVLAGLAVVPLVWAIYFFGFYLGYGNWSVRGHQEFARRGVSQIQPAAKMEKLFQDCRHSIVYAGVDSVSIWSSIAFFGDRYMLTMQVPVDIKSATSGSMIGAPTFYLNEVSSVSVSSSGQVGASFFRDLKFDAAQWSAIYKSGGDLKAIGFTLDSTPVPDFKVYSAASPP